MRFILGKKIEMSQIFNEKGDVIPITLVQAGPCKISQVKKQDKDGYTSVQIGFGQKKSLSKAVKGHLKDLADYQWLKEFRVEDTKDLKRGDKITVDTFEVGDKIKVTGISKGKGFQGVVKRHDFHGSPASHGHKDQLRMPGSIGATEPARVFKGKKMPGQMGNAQVTVKNLEIAKIDNDKNILYLKGAVPGARGSLVIINGEGELKVNTQNTDNKTQEKEDKNKNVETSHGAPKDEKPKENPPTGGEDKKEEKKEENKKAGP